MALRDCVVERRQAAMEEPKTEASPSLIGRHRDAQQLGFRRAGKRTEEDVAMDPTGARSVGRSVAERLDRNPRQRLFGVERRAQRVDRPRTLEGFALERRDGFEVLRPVGPDHRPLVAAVGPRRFGGVVAGGRK